MKIHVHARTAVAFTPFRGAVGLASPPSKLLASRSSIIALGIGLQTRGGQIRAGEKSIHLLSFYMTLLSALSLGGQRATCYHVFSTNRNQNAQFMCRRSTRVAWIEDTHLRHGSHTHTRARNLKHLAPGSRNPTSDSHQYETRDCKKKPLWR